MFDALSTTSSSVAVMSVYKALHHLFERRAPSAVKPGSQGGSFGENIGIGGDPEQESERLYRQVLAEIEQDTSKPLADLSEEEVKKYTEPLARIAQERVLASVAVDRESAEQELQELRKL